jgi:hypothetical protein
MRKWLRMAFLRPFWAVARRVVAVSMRRLRALSYLRRRAVSAKSRKSFRSKRLTPIRIGD